MADLRYKITAEDNFSNTTEKASKSFNQVGTSAEGLTSGFNQITGVGGEVGGIMQKISALTGMSTGQLAGLATGIGVAVVAFKGFQFALQTITGLLQSFFGVMAEGIPMFAQSEKSMYTLAITSKRFGQDSTLAIQKARELSKELGISLYTSASGLSTLMKSGLNLDMASEMLKRFTNEAITGKRENISLSDAVSNLTDMYYMELSALGNMSGISENMANTIKRGEIILNSYNGTVNDQLGITKEMIPLIDQAKANFESQGRAVDSTNQDLAKYVGMISLTNETLGSAEALSETYAGKQTRLQQSLDMMKISLGGLGATFLANSGIMETAGMVIDGLTVAFETLMPYIYGIARAIAGTLGTEVENIKKAMGEFTGKVGANEDSLKMLMGFISGTAQAVIKMFSMGIQATIAVVGGLIIMFQKYYSAMESISAKTGEGAQAIVNAFTGARNAVAGVVASMGNAIISAVEGSINFAIDGLNKLAQTANSVLGTIKEITGIDLGSFKTVDRVALERIVADTQEPPQIKQKVKQFMRNATGLSTIDAFTDATKGYADQLQGFADGYQGMDLSFLDNINEGKPFAGGKGDQASKEAQARDEKLKAEQDLADKIRELKIQQIEDDMTREIEMLKFRTEIEERAMVEKMRKAKATEDEIKSYILASQSNLAFQIGQIQTEYKEKELEDAKKKEEEKKKAKEEKDREKQRKAEELARLTERLDMQKLEALDDGFDKEKKIAEYRANKEIEEYQKSIASTKMKAEYKVARERELQAEIDRIKKQYSKSEDNRTYSQVSIDQVVGSMNFTNATDPKAFLTAIQKLFTSDLESYIKGV